MAITSNLHQEERNLTHTVNKYTPHRELPKHYLLNRKDLNLNLILHVVFTIFGFIIRKQFYKLMNAKIFNQMQILFFGS